MRPKGNRRNKYNGISTTHVPNAHKLVPIYRPSLSVLDTSLASYNQTVLTTTDEIQWKDYNTGGQ
jgi:hypothetical protein